MTTGAPAKQPSRTRPGGRSARIVETVLAGAFEVLKAKGFAEFTIADVALRAGVHETSIYRRWQTRTALALDACLRIVETDLVLPDTGRLEDDLRIFLKRLISLLESPTGRALLSLGATATPTDKDIREKFWQKRFEAASVIVDRAKARGEVPSSVIATTLLQTLAGPIYFRALVTGESLRTWPLDDMIKRIVQSFRA